MVTRHAGLNTVALERGRERPCHQDDPWEVKELGDKWGQDLLLRKLPSRDDLASMSKSDIRQYLGAMAKAVLKGFAHSSDHKQLIWDLKALEPLRSGHVPSERDRNDDGHRLRVKEPTILQEVSAEVINNMDLGTLELLMKKEAISFCSQWKIDDTSLWSSLY